MFARLTKVTFNVLWTPYALLEEVEKYFESFCQKAEKSTPWLELNGKAIP
jgi:hypothetical protein